VDTEDYIDGTQSVRAQTSQLAGILAAGNLFTGQFAGLVGTSGGKVNFGRPWTSRPTALKLYCKYKTGPMDIIGKILPPGTSLTTSDYDRAEIKFALGKKVDFMGGLDHWAQWGGESPRYGKQPSTIKDYVRIIMAKGGGADATVSDQVNVLGNHLGRAFVRVNWRAKDFTFTFQYDKPFEDGTSSRLQNFPDGVWTAQFVMPDKNAWVSEVLYELVTTTWQSGPAHDRPATEEEKAEQDPNDFYYGKVVLGGCDNYFSNGEYASGWTYYGRTIGLPLIIPNAPGADGITRHMASSRVRGHHLGLKGAIAHKLPYAFKSTYHRSWGKYHQGDKSFFASKPWQLSLALDFGFSQFLPKNLPMGLSAGLYADFGQLYQNSAGLTLRINTSNK
jgi:hypothetical protein